MEKIDIELGKKLFENFFEIGNWYSFNENNRTVYMKIEKFIHRKNQPERVFLKGSGFSTINEKLYNPTIKQEISFIYCWAKHELNNNIHYMSEEEVKETFKNACNKIYELYF